MTDAWVATVVSDDMHALGMGTNTPLPVTAVSDDDEDEMEEVPELVDHGNDENDLTPSLVARLNKYEEKTVEKTVEKIAEKPATVRQQIYLDMNSSTDDDDTDDEMPPLEEDNLADALKKIRESPTHEEKLEMDESAQWHMGKVSSKEAEVRWGIEEAEKLSDLESKSSSLNSSTPTSESDSDALCNEERWAEKNEMANILVVLRKEEENNKGMTAAERSQFGFCGTISAEFCNAARKVCNLAGAKRTEMGTVRAVRAVYARAYYGRVYRTHKEAVDAHKASMRNFMYWKRKLGWMAAKYGYPEQIFEGKQMVDLWSTRSGRLGRSSRVTFRGLLR